MPIPVADLHVKIKADLSELKKGVASSNNELKKIGSGNASSGISSLASKFDQLRGKTDELKQRLKDLGASSNEAGRSVSSGLLSRLASSPAVFNAVGAAATIALGLLTKFWRESSAEAEASAARTSSAMSSVLKSFKEVGQVQFADRDSLLEATRAQQARVSQLRSGLQESVGLGGLDESRGSRAATSFLAGAGGFFNSELQSQRNVLAQEEAKLELLQNQFNALEEQTRIRSELLGLGATDVEKEKEKTKEIKEQEKARKELEKNAKKAFGLLDERVKEPITEDTDFSKLTDPLKGLKNRPLGSAASETADADRGPPRYRI